MAAAAPAWLHFMEEIRQDPQASDTRRFIGSARRLARSKSRRQGLTCSPDLRPWPATLDQCEHLDPHPVSCCRAQAWNGTGDSSCSRPGCKIYIAGARGAAFAAATCRDARCPTIASIPASICAVVPCSLSSPQHESGLRIMCRQGFRSVYIVNPCDLFQRRTCPPIMHTSVGVTLHHSLSQFISGQRPRREIRPVICSCSERRARADGLLRPESG